MFGLTFEKLLVIAFIAAVIVGPSRLPQYAQRLAELIRSVRSFLDSARERTEAETGVSLEEWKEMDPRRYDPRRIVREALVAPAEAPREQAAPEEVMRDVEQDGADSGSDVSGRADETAQERPRKWVVVGGSSGHPRRMLVDVDEAPEKEEPEREDVENDRVAVEAA